MHQYIYIYTLLFFIISSTNLTNLFTWKNNFYPVTLFNIIRIQGRGVL